MNVLANEQRTHCDLFSGIGAWSIAAERTGNFRTVGFAETAPYPSAVLQRHWPHVRNYGDIRKVTFKKTGTIDLLTASPPCQPYSKSNNNRGDESDNRILWRELSTVIEDIRPSWFVGEEVSEFAQFHLDDFFTSLEDRAGYTTGAVIIPACAYGDCPHRRDRLWFFAHLADADNPRSQGYRKPTKRTRKGTAWESLPEHLWDTSLAGSIRVVNGFTNWPHRSERIQAIGNSISAPLAHQILKQL